MLENSKCYWTKDSYCSLELNQNEKEIFIIGSCDPTRRKFIDMIIDVIRNNFDMIPTFAEDISQNNGYKAFCSNICSSIIRSTLVIVDLSAPIKNISCSNCKKDTEILQQSVNVYWEYGYACGLGKRILLLLDESQISKIPFDVADTQIELYNVNNLRDKLRRLLEMKLKEPFPQNRYEIIPPTLPPTPIAGPNDHRIQPIIDLLKYKIVDYYREIRPEKMRIISVLFDVLGTFNSILYEKYGKGSNVNRFIKDYFNGMSIEDFKSYVKKEDTDIKIPRRSSLIIAGDFALKTQKYINNHYNLKRILISNVHGEFDTEIRKHKIFPQDLRIDEEFQPAIK